MIDLYTAATPNGWKVSIALEELGLPYEVHVVDLGSGAQKEPWFTAINPNGRIPAIVDRDKDDFPVFESGAILVYLAEKAGKLMPSDAKGRSLVMQWLMFQMGGVGPMMGQANVFTRYFPEQIPSVQQRYLRESRRLLEILDGQLARGEWLLGDRYSPADAYPLTFLRWARRQDFDMSGFVHWRAHAARMLERPAVLRALATEGLDPSEF